MDHRVFVYGTLMRGEVNHGLLAGAALLGPHRTAPCFGLLRVGAYPGAVRGGRGAIRGEVYRIDSAGLRRLDHLEEYPKLYDRQLIPTPYGRAWIYLYRGPRVDRPTIVGGDWRAFAADPDSYRSAGVRRTRDPKNRQTRATAPSGPRPLAGGTIHQPRAPSSSRNRSGVSMSEEGRFTIQLEQQEGFQVKVGFDWRRVPDLLMDEGPPLGEQAGPNASRLLAAAAANCLVASLVHCVFKDEPPPRCLRAEATCIMVRNDKKRLRIGGLEVKLIAAEVLTRSPRFPRCMELFEDFCVVSASIRQGIPIQVTIVDEAGTVLHQSA
jgi:gamma-glutamylcyclotransferase (GGCT)/AIG2-like uncharacterized protein YtfP